MKLITILYTTIMLMLLLACSGEKQKESITQGGMKCGPGKCGASMMDGSTVLVNKKMNILNQLAEDDSRRECVLTANTTKDLYNCVRVEKTGRLSTKCSTDNTVISSSMKCEVGKCASGMKKVIPKNTIQKSELSSMKCEVGKCG